MIKVDYFAVVRGGSLIKTPHLITYWVRWLNIAKLVALAMLGNVMLD
jgi:hypothetical protein